MQKTLKELIEDSVDIKGKIVAVCIQSGLKVLEGSWNWEMQTEAVYCSDVMDFPGHFEGTKGIIHPDDVKHVSSALKLLEDNEALKLEFRIITTYGEVKNISGYNISIFRQKKEEPEVIRWEETTREIENRNELARLQLLKEIADATEKLYNLGTWLINKSNGDVYYSNNVFRIHGLPPQSLNAHAHTFHSFFHPEDSVTVTDVLENAYSKELPLDLQYRIIKPNGETRNIHLSTRWLYNKKGQPVVSGILQDVTDQVEQSGSILNIESLLKLQKQTLELMEQQSNIGYWYINLLTRKTIFSDNYLHIFGIKQTGLPSSNAFMDLVHPDDRQIVEASIEKMYHHHEPPDLEFRIIRPDGKIKQLKQTGKLVIYDNSELIMIGMVQDVSAKRLADSKVKEDQEAAELQKAVYSFLEDSVRISSVIWFLPDGNMSWSDGFYSLLGYKPQSVEPLQRLILKYIDSRDLKSFTDTVALALNGQTQHELVFRLITKKGLRQLKLSFRSAIAGSKQAVIGLIQDITRQTARKQQLEEVIRFNELVLSSVNDCIFFTNTDNAVMNWNIGAEEKTGIKKSNAISRNLFDLFPALKAEEHLNHLHQAFRGEKVTSLGCRSGYLNKPHNYYLIPSKDEKGDVTGVLHIIRDASNEMALQQKLSERLNFIESLVEASVDRIVVLDRNMNYLYWNHKAEEYYAINKHRVLGKNILEIFPAFRNDPAFQDFRKVLKGETVHLSVSTNKDVEEYSETFLIPVKDEAGSVIAILWVVHDLSKDFELQHLQQKAAEVLNNMDAIIVELDNHYRFTYINDAAGMYMGGNRNELIGKTLMEQYPRTVHSVGFQAIEKAIKEKVKTEVEYYSPLLNKWVFLSAAPTREGAILFFYDRQDIKETQQKLLEEHRRLKEAQAIGHLGNFEQDLPGNTVIWSDELFRIHGMEPQSVEMNSGRIYAMVHPDDRQAFIEAIDRFHQRKEPFHLTNRIIRVDNGEVRYVLRRAEMICNEDGEPVRIHGTVQDITEQVKTDIILETINEVIFELNEQFIITYANRRAYECWRLTQQDVIGRNIWELFPEDIDTDIYRELQTAMCEKKNVLFEAWCPVIHRWILLNANPSPTGLIVMHTDITEQVETRALAREREQQFVSLVENTPDAVSRWDRNLKLVFCNTAFKKKVGVPEAGLLGKTALELGYPKDIADPWMEKLKMVFDSGEPVIHYNNIGLPSGLIHYYSRMVPEFGPDGNVQTVLAIARDITEMVKTEDKLKELNQSLQQQNKELAIKNEELSSFAFIASHDLREPLRKVQVFSDWILSKEAENLSEKGRYLIQRTADSINKMDALIDDMLVLSRLHNENRELEEVNLKEVLKNVRSGLKETILQKKAVIEDASLPVIQGNKNQLNYLFSNILNNALKFQKPGSRPQVNISAKIIKGSAIDHPKADASRNYYCISFKDNGIGFDQAYATRIFQIFQRLHGNHEFPGTGIGLAICKKVMENHNGFIEANSEVGNGACFCCYFPA